MIAEPELHALYVAATTTPAVSLAGRIVSAIGPAAAAVAALDPADAAAGGAQVTTTASGGMYESPEMLFAYGNDGGAIVAATVSTGEMSWSLTATDGSAGAGFATAAATALSPGVGAGMDGHVSVTMTAGTDTDSAQLTPAGPLLDSPEPDDRPEPLDAQLAEAAGRAFEVHADRRQRLLDLDAEISALSDGTAAGVGGDDPTAAGGAGASVPPQPVAGAGGGAAAEKTAASVGGAGAVAAAAIFRQAAVRGARHMMSRRRDAAPTDGDEIVEAPPLPSDASPTGPAHHTDPEPTITPDPAHADTARQEWWSGEDEPPDPDPAPRETPPEEPPGDDQPWWAQA